MQAWQFLGANVLLGDDAGAAVKVRERSPGAGAVLGLASSMLAKSAAPQLVLCVHSKVRLFFIFIFYYFYFYFLLPCQIVRILLTI